MDPRLSVLTFYSVKAGTSQGVIFSYEHFFQYDIMLV